MLRIVLLLAASVMAGPDLVAPFTVDLVSTKHPLWDTVQVTAYLLNLGSTDTPVHTFDAVILDVRMDSVPFGPKSHSIPTGLVLGAGKSVVLASQGIVPKGPFSIATWCDPLGHFGEGGGQVANNVRSQAYNFYPKVIRDTVKVVVHDTVKYCPPASAKQTATAKPPQSFAVYSMAGQLLKACRE